MNHTISDRTSPLITVIAMCYNHERFVEECLKSIGQQSFQDFELVISDDASVDRSADIITAWIAEFRPDTRFIRNGINRGVCATLNSCIDAARGRYIAMVSTDDMWELTKLEQQLGYMETQQDTVAMVYSDASLIDIENKKLPGLFIERYWPELTPPSGNIRDFLLERNFIPAMATLIRSDALCALGGYDERLAYEDWDMWLRMSHRYRIGYMPGAVARYRITPGSLGDQLFGLRTRNVTLTACRIASKVLHQGDLNAAQRSAWLSRLQDATYELYKAGHAEAPHFLRVVAIRSRSPKRALVAATATLGISRRRMQHLRGMLRLSSPQ